MKKKSLLTYVTPDDPPVKKAVISSIEVLSGRKKLEKIYESVLDGHAGGSSFWEAALRELDINLECDLQVLEEIPRSGPVIFVANHPYGVLDGLTICYLASRARPNFKILIHKALCREERIADFLLPIDFSETKEAVLTNVNTKRESMATLREGGAIVIFPAGGISTSHNLFGPAIDLEWKLFMAKLVQMTEATVVPVFFHGQNGRMFQLVSQFSQTLRLSLIIREVNKQRGKTLQVSIGEPIHYQQLAHIRSRNQLTNHLRQVTYELGNVDPQLALTPSIIERKKLDLRKLRRQKKLSADS